MCFVMDHHWGPENEIGHTAERAPRMTVFKNALCLAGIPDAAGYSGVPYSLQCKRRTGHPKKHRVVFRDGGVREWNSGDSDSTLRQRRTRVAGSNYVLHIPKPGSPRTFCGRETSRVNCVAGTDGPDRLCEDEGCQKCVVAYQQKGLADGQ